MSIKKIPNVAYIKSAKSLEENYPFQTTFKQQLTLTQFCQTTSVAKHQ